MKFDSGLGRVFRQFSTSIGFVFDTDISEDLIRVKEVSQQAKFAIAFWKFSPNVDFMDMASVFSKQLNCPFDVKDSPIPWVIFLDNLMFVAHEYDGALFIIDNAQKFMNFNRREFFGSIQTFSLASKHWVKTNKPLFVAYNMVENQIDSLSERGS